MGSKVTVERKARVVRYPHQLVAMVDGSMNEAVRELAEERGEHIAETLRHLIGSALATERRRRRAA